MAAAVIVAGTAFSAYSAYQSGQARAEQARQNAQALEAAAADALQRGEYRAWRIRLAFARRESEQVVGFAHGGVDVSSGSPAATIAKTRMIGELDAEMSRNNAFREAWGYRTQAIYAREAASRYETSSWLDAAGALAGGAGRMAGMSGPGGPTGADLSPGGSHEGWT